MKTLFKILMILTSSFILAGCGGQAAFREVSGDVWTTSYHVKYESPEERLADSIACILERVDNSLSMFNDSSLVSRVNRNDSTVRADRMLRDIFQLSRQINKESHGAFDPTVAPLVDLWGFGRVGNLNRVPTAEEIGNALDKVGMGECNVVSDGRVVKKSPGTRFDFSAIAKGYACDEIARLLRSHSVNNFLIEIGGEIVAGGVNPEGKPWRILIDNPLDSSETVGDSGVKIVELSNKGIATSGNYRRYRLQNGRNIGHILDPTTGYPRESEVLSATVIAPDCATADALATACMAMPAVEAESMLRRLKDIQGILVIRENSRNIPRVFTIE